MPNLKRRLQWLRVVVAVFFFPALPLPAQTDVWIDTDPSIGMAFRDADDGFALIQAFHSPELRIVGISVSYGNASLASSLEIARDLSTRFGAEAGVTSKNVFPGAASADDLGRPSAACDALATILATRHLTYLALGPLTNLATLLKRRPDLADHIDRVIFIGGRLPGEQLRLGNRLPYEFHDANFEKDSLAMLTVLRTSIPIELVPVAASKKVLFTPQDLAVLGQRGGVAGQFLQNNTKLWLRSWRGLFGLEGGPAFDCLAILAVTNPGELVSRESRARVSSDLKSVAPITLENTREKRFLLVDPPEAPPDPSGRMVLYHFATKSGAKQRILDALLKRPDPAPALPLTPLPSSLE